MASPVAAPPALVPAPEPAQLPVALRFAQFSPVGLLCLIVLVAMIAVAALADVVAPYDPLEPDYSALRQAPSAAHWLGTDNLGRDMLSRLIHGARITLVVAVSAALIGDFLGLVWGVTSGYFGGRFDLISQRIVELLMTIPALILAMLLMVGLGSGVHTVVIAIAVTRVPRSTRVMRSLVLSVKEMAYVESARAVGAHPLRILALHVAPQCRALFLVLLSIHIGEAIFAESALSFLGIGVPPPTPTWGGMLGSALAEAFRPLWWVVVVPGAAITVTILCTNLLGDALRDFLDPRLKV